MKREDNPTLRKLKKGEVCYVERKYTADKNFNFFGKEKLESIDDVAYIFKQLQTASVENVFIVYVKDNKPVIQHLSMGTYNATLIDYNPIRDGINRFNPDKVYVVHNHPSGNLNPSLMDRNVLEKLRDNYGDIIQEGIIINTTSGYYSTFDDYSKLETGALESDSKNQIKHKVLKFDKQLFYNGSNNLKQVATSKEIAEFISLQRLADIPKVGAIILNRSNHITANIHIPITEINEKTRNELINYLSSSVARFGGTHVVGYGKINHISRELQEEMKIIQKALKNEDVYLLDFINVKSSPNIDIKQNYQSFADEALFEEKVKYRNKGNTMEL